MITFKRLRSLFPKLREEDKILGAMFCAEFLYLLIASLVKWNRELVGIVGLAAFLSAGFGISSIARVDQRRRHQQLRDY